MGMQRLHGGRRVVGRVLTMAGEHGKGRQGQADSEQIPHGVPPSQPTAFTAWISSAPAFCASP